MSEGVKKITSKLGKFKYPLIVLAVGILLMLLPTGKASTVQAAGAMSTKDEERMEYVLSGIDGAGDVRALLSDNGAVIVCAGADNPRVRLDMTNAVASFTGFGSDKITILKFADKSMGEAAK